MFILTHCWGKLIKIQLLWSLRHTLLSWCMLEPTLSATMSCFFSSVDKIIFQLSWFLGINTMTGKYNVLHTQLRYLLITISDLTQQGWFAFSCPMLASKYHRHLTVSESTTKVLVLHISEGFLPLPLSSAGGHLERQLQLLSHLLTFKWYFRIHFEEHIKLDWNLIYHIIIKKCYLKRMFFEFLLNFQQLISGW